MAEITNPNDPFCIGLRLSDRVCDVLREQILSGVFTPGERLNEVKLAHKLGVSRAPVREAILQLANEGLVEIHPHRGAFVRSIEEQELKEIAEVRALLEAAAARELVEAGLHPEIELLLTQQLDAMQKAVANDDKAQLMQAHLAFHEVIVKNTQNRVMRTLLLQMRDQIATFIRLGHLHFIEESVESLVKDHQQLLQVMQQGDGPTIEKAYRNHIRFLHKTSKS
ncbi:MAG: GntR family transcriptional regulator [Firmicutes bacterium]|nr:GntR family transcriptional regulator [Bacillota bacterium]